METTIKKLADENHMTPKEFVQYFDINFTHEWIVEDEQENHCVSFETIAEVEEYINGCISSDDNIFVHNTKTGKKHEVVKYVKVLGVEQC